MKDFKNLCQQIPMDCFLFCFLFVKIKFRKYIFLKHEFQTENCTCIDFRILDVFSCSKRQMVTF